MLGRQLRPEALASAASASLDGPGQTARPARTKRGATRGPGGATPSPPRAPGAPARRDDHAAACSSAAPGLPSRFSRRTSEAGMRAFQERAHGDEVAPSPWPTRPPLGAGTGVPPFSFKWVVRIQPGFIKKIKPVRSQGALPAIGNRSSRKIWPSLFAIPQSAHKRRGWSDCLRQYRSKGDTAGLQSPLLHLTPPAS